jgi:UDP-3-O-[3-hydroxymyristoyl] glucosamine N-acyltransferase
MPGAYIGHHVIIGKNCIIHPQVTILDHCRLGDNVIVQSGTVIGSDAFYYNRKKHLTHQYRKMKSCGRVHIEDYVEIGAGCTIDRGVTADTIIGAGTKIDNQVHIGHDCVIGKNCLLAAQVGLAGAVTVEDEVILWGQVGVNKTLTIGEGAVVFGQSGVASSIEGKKTYWGTPAIDFNEKRRELVWVKRIPSLWEKVKSMLG